MNDRKWIEIILYLLDALEDEHMGLREEYIEIIKEEFGIDFTDT